MSDKSDQEKEEALNIKVMGHDQSVVQFKIKPRTNFAKLMKIYCERMNLSPEVVRFMFDGQRVLKSDSPGNIGMIEGDTLEVMTLQEGGHLK